MFILFIKGIGVGFLVAMPPGPLGLLCMRRALTNGFFSGLFSGVGVAIADSMYGGIAAFGLKVVMQFFVEHHMILRLIAGIALLYVGIRTIRRRVRMLLVTGAKRQLHKDFLSSFLLTFLNPTTLLSFFAITALFKAGVEPDNYIGIMSLLAGIFLGALSWFAMLSGLISLWRMRITQKTLDHINIISGSLITIGGIVILGSVVQSSCV